MSWLASGDKIVTSPVEVLIDTSLGRSCSVSGIGAVLPAEDVSEDGGVGVFVAIKEKIKLR